jgi:hypothetical protein
VGFSAAVFAPAAFSSAYLNTTDNRTWVPSLSVIDGQVITPESEFFAAFEEFDLADDGDSILGDLEFAHGFGCDLTNDVTA